MISRGIILVTFLGVSIPLFSQTHAVDSMRRLVATLSDPFLKMEQYYRIGANLYEVDFDKGSLYADSAHSVALQLNRKDWLWKTYVLKALMIDDPGRRDEAIGFHEQGLKVVREIGFEEGIRIQLVNLGGMYQEKGDLNKALDYYRQARQTLTIDSTPKLKETRITLHKNIGQILKDKNQLEEAVKEYLEGVSLCKKYGVTKSLWGFYNNLATLYGRMGDQKAKIQYCREGLKVVPPNNVFITTLWNNLANGFMHLGRLDSAAWYYQKSLQHPKVSKPSQIAAYNGLAQVRNLEGKHQEAYDWATKALPLALENEDPMEVVKTHTKLGRSLVGLKKYPEAIEVLMKAKEIIKENRNYSFLEEKSIIDFYLARAQLLEKGDEGTSELIDDFSKARDSLFNQNMANTIEGYRIKFETRQKEDSLRILQNENVIHQLKNRQNRQLLGGMALITLLLAAILGLTWRNLRYARREKAFLADKYEELKLANENLLNKVAEAGSNGHSQKALREQTITLTNKEKTKLQLKEIIYLEAQGNAVIIHTPDAEYWDWQRLKHYKKLLPQLLFVQIHRSFIVNRHEVRGYTANRVIMKAGEELPLGGSFQQQVQAQLQEESFA